MRAKWVGAELPSEDQEGGIESQHVRVGHALTHPRHHQWTPLTPKLPVTEFQGEHPRALKLFIRSEGNQLAVGDTD